MLSGKIVVSSNANPDLDGYACALAYAELLRKQGKDVKAVLLGDHQGEIDFVVHYLNDKILKPYNRDFSEFDSIVIVDTSNLDTLKSGLNTDKLKLIIDHRMVNDAHLYHKANILIEAVGACATLITEEFIKSHIKPSKNIAVYLYSAIVSNTINFKNKVTTNRDRKAVEYLKTLIAVPNNFAEELFKAKSDFEGEKLKQHLRMDKVAKDIGGGLSIAFQIEMVNAKDLIKNRIADLEKYITEIISDEEVKTCYVNIIDTMEGYNLIYAWNAATEAMLSKALNVKFTNKIAWTDYIIMRKEILLKIHQI